MEHNDGSHDEINRDASDPSDQKILKALIVDDHETIEEYLRNSANPNRLIHVGGRLLSPLHLACALGKQNYLDIFQRFNVKINILDSKGKSPLYYASRNGHQQVVESLIKLKADVDVQDQEGSCIHAACDNGCHQVVETLIKAQADVNLQDINGCSPLHIASRKGHEKMVESLIKAQADINLQCATGESPLIIASTKAHLKVVELLIKAQADVNHQESTGQSALYIAASNGNQQVVDSLIKNQADANLQDIRGCSPLHTASNNGHHTVVESLIRALADVNLQQVNGYSPLHFASESGHHKVVELLIKAQADVNLQDKVYISSPIYAASQNGHYKIVKLLIKAQADVNLQENVYGSTPIFAASQNGHQKVVELLIKAQADVNLQKDQGISPLVMASHNGHHKVVELLIKAQADIDLQEVDGCSPLYMAAQNGHEKIVESLIKAQANVNLPEIDGSSPFNIAFSKGHHKVVDLLIKAQAEVDHHRNDRPTTLQIASCNGQDQIVDALIKAHADVNLKDKIFYCSPIYVASQKGHENIVETLIKAFADANLQQMREVKSSVDTGSHQDDDVVIDSHLEAQVVAQVIDTGESPLYTACVNGHHKVVQSLIKAQADVNLTQIDNCSPLYIASEKGYHEIVESLIKAQANVNLQQKTGKSPIYIACGKGHDKVVESLITAQADVNLQEEVESCSPLYIAASNGHHRVVELLIKAQADVDLQRNTGSSALYIASQKGHHKIVKSIITAQADVNRQEKQGISPLYIASQEDHYKVVQSLIEAQASVNIRLKNGMSPLHAASQNGHHTIVELLIKAKADVSAQFNNGMSALYIASHNEHQKVVKSLIKSETDLNLQAKVNDFFPLLTASLHGYKEIVELLIKSEADVNFQRSFDGYSCLYIASSEGYHEIAESLIKAQADVNLKTKKGKSPLHIASENGHHKVVEELIKAQADFNLVDNSGHSPLEIATHQGYQEVVNLLIKAQADPEPQNGYDCSNTEVGRLQDDLKLITEKLEFYQKAVPSDPELSRQLNSALTQSGFVDSRAALQSAAADVLQEILRRRRNYDGIFVVGSYSEGWGNSLTTLDGRTDIESDIDMMQLILGRLYHPRGLCECDGDPELHELSNGHILCGGFASHPASPSEGAALRPALDDVPAGRLCRYPPIAPLQPHRVSSSNIPQSVLQALQHDLTSDSSPCHVVHAASPGRGGHELRVSTSFLEKRMLRSLSTLQGQLFVTLKYLVKKVICHEDGFNEQGLKSYHVKTITFRMVEETPVEQWKPENLVSLTRRSLQMLCDCVESSRTPDNAHGRIMQHFFMSDAGLYLKGLGQNDQSTDQTLSSIAKTLRTVIDELPRWLLQFKSSLRPVSDSGLFYFHPFQILPLLIPRPLSKSSRLEYHEIYDVVRESLLRLSHTDCSPQSQESLVQLIARLPDCALTAREALRALACLKLGYRSTAERIVSECRGHSVSRGIAWSAERSAAEATAEFVWQHLRSHDSAWKFCFEFEQRPKLPFLTEALNNQIPLLVLYGSNCFYLNFDAVLWALRVEQLTESKGQLEDWIRNFSERDDTDKQELNSAVSLITQPHEIRLIYDFQEKTRGVSCGWQREQLKRAFGIE